MPVMHSSKTKAKRKRTIAARKFLALASLLIYAGILSPQAQSTNYVFRTSNKIVKSSSLGADTVTAFVIVDKVRHPGLYIASKPQTGVGSDMGLNKGFVLLTIDGYSITTAQIADNWIKRRPDKPLQYSYAVISDGKAKIYSGSVPFHNPDGSSSSSSSQGSFNFSGKEVSISALESYCLQLINESRKKGGMAPVQNDSSLARLARSYSDYMAQNASSYELSARDNAHIDPQGRGPQERAQMAGISSQVFENICRSSRSAFQSDMDNVRGMHQSMMNEGPGGGHYMTIMDPQARTVGIGISRLPSRMYLTEEFGH